MYVNVYYMYCCIIIYKNRFCEFHSKIKKNENKNDNMHMKEGQMEIESFKPYILNWPKKPRNSSSYF